MSRKRVFHVLAGCSALAATLLMTASAFADAQTGVVLNSYNVTGTINEGQAISISLQYSVSPTNESGPAGTTTHRLTSNSVTHNISGPAGGSAVTSDPDTAITHSASTSFTIVQDGGYTVSFSDAIPINVVENSSFGLGSNNLNTTRNLSSSRNVTVLNVAPTITSATLNGTNGNISVPEGSSVTAQMSSTDPGADPQTFTINGNAAGVGGSTPGSTRTSSAVNLGTFNQDGAFNVNFNVADDDTNTALNRTITVTNVAPTIVSALLNGTNGNITVPEGSTVTFQASSTDPGADAQTFTISGTPGGPYVSTDTATSGTRTSALSSELFADEGVFNVNFNVADDDTSVDVGRTLTVQNVGPTITSISLSGTYSPNAAIPFTASATDPGVNDVLTFSWDFDGDNVIDLVDVVGSGGSGTSAGTIPAFFFPSPPENPGFTVYNGVLTVDDGDGGVDTVNFSLTIIPEPSSFVMAGFAAVAGLLALRRRRRNA